MGSYAAAIKQVFPDAEHIQSEGLRARLNNNLSERLQSTIRERDKTLRALETMESGQDYFDGRAIDCNMFRDHEGIRGRTPAEMTGVNPPFTEWADVVGVAATGMERKASNPVRTLADVADRADRHSKDTAPPTTHFVTDPTLRRRPKGETESDGPDEYPLSRPGRLPPRRNKVRTEWNLWMQAS